MSEILHFGPGNFFRAHLADYTQDAGGWGITAVSLRSSGVRDGLASQANRYILAAHGKDNKVVDVIEHIYVASEDRQRVLDLVADARFSIISATVTEKGYHLTPDGNLNVDDPDIKHDLALGLPRTFIGFLALGLAQRNAPVTVLSCDNRLGNGDALAKAVSDFQALSGLRSSCEVSFPNAMVDRITPATTDTLRLETGDQMAVSCEPFKEWVIEDRFVSAHPDWPGVKWVDDVAPHEKRKLRMLNGAHSYLAYAGILSGHTYVHEAIGDATLRQTTRALMKEAAMTLPANLRSIADAYANSLVSRFDNNNVNHKLRQIAMDGTEKVPYRLLDSLRENLAAGRASPQLIAAINAWITFVRTEVKAGRAPEDPRAEALCDAARSETPTASILSVINASDLKSHFLE